ncbi:MAG TPA: T9SS type A sorting domain-containing protein [Flavobacteriales bacterium]|nr:T9SS type A sorting domain-containing protein [Flavobacteriales bacterium]
MKKLLLLAFLLPTHAFATTHLVTNTNNAGAGSLRQCIITASAGDTVKMDPMLIATGSATINLYSEIVLNKNLYIKGIFTSYDTLYISGSDSCRIFNMTSGNVTLYGCTLVHGKAANGGAINETGGTLLIDHCNLMNNYSSGYGGAINQNGGTIQFQHSQIFNNTAASDGGGVYLYPGSGYVISYSTFYNNHSDTYGGAIYGFVSSANIDHCTFVGNSATTEGGAIYDWGSSVILNVTNSTFTGNTAPSASAIVLWGSGVQFTVGSSIIAGNSTGANLYVWGAGATSTSLGYNYFGDASVMGSVGTDNLSTPVGILNLTGLQDNGSYTYTCMPQTPSLAVNDGNPADLSDAQNAVITDGMRDAGAAEYFACPNKRSSFFAHGCASYTVPSGDETYTGTGLVIAMDTIPTSCGADSVMTIYIVLTDVVGPVADVANIDATFECSATPTAPTATDACTGAATGTTSTSFPITTPGVTVVTWTYTDGIGNTSTQTQNITVIPIDNSVTQSGITLTAASVGSTYQWLDCNNAFAPIPGATSQSFTPSIDGNYACALTNGSCTDSTACTSVVGTGVNEINAIDFTVYPNPTNGDFTLVSPVAGDVTVLSIEGKVILNRVKMNASQQTFNLTNVDRGVYFVRLSNAKGEKTIKLVVQ